MASQKEQGVSRGVMLQREPIGLGEPSEVVLKEVNAILLRGLFGSGKDMELADGWQAKGYRLLPNIFSPGMEYRNGQDLIFSHNSELGIMIVGFSQFIDPSVKEEIVNQISERRDGNPIYNEEKMVAPDKDSLVSLVAWGNESNLSDVESQIRIIFPLIYPDNFQRV